MTFRTNFIKGKNIIRKFSNTKWSLVSSIYTLIVDQDVDDVVVLASTPCPVLYDPRLIIVPSGASTQEPRKSNPEAVVRLVPLPERAAPPAKLRVPILPPYTITQVPSRVMSVTSVTGPAFNALTCSPI